MPPRLIFMTLARLVTSVGRIVIATLGTILLGLAVVFVLVRQPVPSSDNPLVRSRAEASRLEKDVRHLTNHFPSRNADHPEVLHSAADWIASEFLAAGGAVTTQGYRARGNDYVNVIASFGPEGGAGTVVGAHYDVFGDLPGADDNASGVAGLLELARLLGTSRLGARVELVAYSTEEPPFFASDQMGSAIHADSLRATGPLPRAMICLEMIGCFIDRQPSTGTILDLLYPSHGQFIAIVGRWSDRRLARSLGRSYRGLGEIEAVIFAGPRSIGTDASDHRSYWSRGVPAVMITDTAYLRNDLYHTVEDTADTLDYDRMARVVDGVANAVVRMSQ